MHGELKSNKRRIWGAALALMVATSGAAGGCAPFYSMIGGAFRGDPALMHAELSDDARRLLAEALEGIEEGRFVDYHIHHISDDVHPDWLSCCKPVALARTMVYLSAADVQLSHRAAEDHLDRLLTLIEHGRVAGRYYLYALDHHYLSDGTLDLDRTPIHVSNESVVAAAARAPGTIIPVVSIHPFRRDAMGELRYWAERGVRHVKWLPNSMGFDPSDPRLDGFYDALRELEMVLLTHTGDEDALENHYPQVSNPLLLRRALDRGVTVVALHSASSGRYPDLDHPDQPCASGFDLLLRLMDDPKYETLLFGELAGIIFFNHLPYPLMKLLERPDLHHRFINGSDYPLSAINVVIRTRQLVNLGLITPRQRLALNEIYNYNPLLFDFVVKRTVRHPATGQRLSPIIFTARAPLQ